MEVCMYCALQINASNVLILPFTLLFSNNETRSSLSSDLRTSLSSATLKSGDDADKYANILALGL